MKKALQTILIVMMSLLALVSCSQEKAISDQLVSATLVSTDRVSKALETEVDFDLSAVKLWKYTARKANGGLKTGETSTGTENAVALTNGETKGLSQGAWNFVLYGYDATESGNLIAQGSINNATVTTTYHVVTITVNPVQTSGAKGKIVISDNIAIQSTDGKTSYKSTEEDYTMSYKVYKTTDTKKTALKSLDSVDVGSYTVEVTFKSTANGVSYTAATGSKVFNVYAGLTTTIKGVLEETVQAATIEKEAGTFVDIKSETVSSDTLNTALTMTVNASPVGADKTTEINFPANSLTLGSNENKELKLKVVATSSETVASTYTVENAGTAVAGLDLSLEGATIGSMEDDSGISITTYIATGLDESKLNIVYNGEESEGQKSAKKTSYESGTGKLVFKVYHFSEYVITTTENIAFDDTSFRKEITEAPSSGDATEIKLVKDITLSASTIELNKSLTFNLNKHTITFTQNEPNNRVFGLLKSDTAYTVTFKDGNIKGNGRTLSSSNLFIVDKNSKLVLDNVKIDAAIHTCVYLYVGANPSSLELKNSTLTIKGAYGVSTNAGDKDATTNVTVTSSTINVTREGDGNDQDCTGMIVNVAAKVSITDSTITGQKQGMILRGTGTEAVSIKNTTISSTGTKLAKSSTNTTGYTDVPVDTAEAWNNGNGVPLAALVIGNKGTGYPRATNVSLEKVTLLTPSESSGRVKLYVYQANTTNTVSVSGTIVDYDSISKNSEMNEATVNLTAYTTAQ